MLGKLNHLKWSSDNNGRDLIFLVVILAFGIILVAKLAPYYRGTGQSVAYNKVQTTPSVPKSFLEQFSFSPVLGRPQDGSRSSKASFSAAAKTDSNRPTVIERPLFDGQYVLLRVRSLNNYSSEAGQPIEASVVAVTGNSQGEIDAGPAMKAKLVGAASPNFSEKRLHITFSELISTDGRTYSVQGQAVSPDTLTSGIEGNYSSGLPARLLGIAIDRTIMAADQIGTAYLFSAVGPSGPAGQELRAAAMETNQQASQNIAAAATQDLRDTPARIDLPVGSQFYVRVRGSQNGARP